VVCVLLRRKQSKTRNTFNATGPAPTNSAIVMRATKVYREPAL